MNYLKRNFSILFFLLLLTYQPVGSQNITDIDDGPYIFWEGKKASVTYVAKGKIYKHEIDATGKKKITVEIKKLDQSLTLSPRKPRIEPNSYRRVKKIFVVSDIHGQYKTFVQMLKAHHIIDENLKWNFGKGHLVVLGDVFDRGSRVTESLWLIHQLEKQARKSKGRVHMTLGNHEVMVLQDDLRYLHKKYKTVTKKLLHRKMSDLYGPTSELGRWLRTRHTIIKINDILFVHGGIHPYVMVNRYTIKWMNKMIRKNIDTPRKEIRADRELSFLFRGMGPLWYRGYFEGNKKYHKIGMMQVKLLQSYFGVNQIVVGHTTHEHVHSLFSNCIVVVDSGFKYGDRGEGLLFKKGKVYQAFLDGKLKVLEIMK
jgi:Calcineurin-like phosphoesterase